MYSKFWHSLIDASVVLGIFFGAIALLVGAVMATFHTFFEYGWWGFPFLFIELVVFIALVNTFSTGDDK